MLVEEVRKHKKRNSAAQLFLGPMRKYQKNAEDWDTRLGRPFSMALTDDVKKGKVTQDSYDKIQKIFTDQVTEYVEEEILALRELNLVHGKADNTLNFADFGIGEGGLLGIAQKAIDAGYNYQAIDFSQAACKIGVAKLNNIFEEYTLTHPVEQMVRRGILQQIFQDTGSHRERFSLGLFSRILQHNYDALETIVPFIPSKTKFSGRAIIVTPLKDHNRNVKHKDFLPFSREDLLESLYSKLPIGQHWDIINQIDFQVGPEVYSCLTIAQVT